MNLEMVQAAQVQQQQQLNRHFSFTRLEACAEAHSFSLPRPVATDPVIGDQFSSTAMLFGTVAALQEESSLMRSQYQSDVSRLERELQELRSVAAAALPQLRQEHPDIQIDTDFSGPCLSESSRVWTPRASMLLQPSPRMLTQLEATIPLTPVRSTETRDATEGEAMPQVFHMDSEESAQILELYKELERLSVALQQKTQENAKLKEEIEARDEVHVRDVDVLDAMSMVLQQKSEENMKLKEEMEACEAAHARDISALEEMIHQLASDKPEPVKMAEDVPTVPCSKVGSIGDSTMSIYSSSHTLVKEPEREESPNLDNSCARYPRARACTPRELQIMSGLPTLCA